MINPSVGGLAVISELDGITYLTRYNVSIEFLLSCILFMKVLGVASPREVFPKLTIVE